MININWIYEKQIVLFLCFICALLDSIFTRRSLMYLKNKGVVNWEEAEANIIPKKIFKIFDNNLTGFFIGLFIAFFLIYLIYLIFPTNFMYIILGGFIPVLTIHYQNMKFLSKQRK